MIIKIENPLQAVVALALVVFPGTYYVLSGTVKGAVLYTALTFFILFAGWYAVSIAFFFILSVLSELLERSGDKKPER